jgi:hypothetical protein
MPLIYNSTQLNSIGLSLPHRKHVTSPLRAQQVNAVFRFKVMIYMNINITVLGIIHRRVIYLKHDVSETGLFPSSVRTYSDGPSMKS